MANVTYFVSETKMKNFTAVSENVNVKDMLPYIVIAQDIDLQIVLGSQFYKVLEAQIIAGNVTDVNVTLIDDYIAPFLLNAAMYHMIPFTYIKLRNKGLLKGTAEEATSADLKDVHFYRDAVRTTKEFYSERLRRELVMNMNAYPDYAQIVTNQNLLPNRRESFGGGMAIPNRGSKVNNQNYGAGMNGTIVPSENPQGPTEWEKFGPM